MYCVKLPPDPDAILTPQEVAEWLKLKPRQVQRLGFPSFVLGRKTRRYRAGEVVAHLETLRRPGR